MQPMRYRMYAAMDKGSRKDQQDAVNSSFPGSQVCSPDNGEDPRRQVDQYVRRDQRERQSACRSD